MSGFWRWVWGKVKAHGVPLAGLAVLVVAAIGSPLWDSSLVLSSPSGDVVAQYFHTRSFAAREILGGSFPFWNPFLYSGVPFFGDFQSALLYPPNLIFLFLPVSLAISWSFGIHVFLLGAGTYAWALQRGAERFAAFVAGGIAMFCGSFFLHIYAGHLSNVCTVAWFPFLFLAMDRWVETRRVGWVLCGAVAVVLQVFAGHVQYVYFGAMVAAIYGFGCVCFVPGNRLLPAIGLLAIYPLAFVLGAVQILPGLDAAAESVRGGGTPYEFAAMFSFPPENAATLFVPGFFGSLPSGWYWGRCYLWEMNLFLGSGGILLAVYGIFWKKREAWFWLVLLGLIAVLALGAHTPLHRVLYDFFPGFGSFRGASKFVFFLGLFGALLAGFGMQRLLAEAVSKVWVPVVAAVCSTVFFAFAVWFGGGGVEWFVWGVEKVRETGEIFYSATQVEDAVAVDRARGVAEGALRLAAVSFGVFAIVWLVAKKWCWGRWLLGVAVVGEMFFFARSSVVFFPQNAGEFAHLREGLRKIPGDFRILNMVNPSAGISVLREEIWGYEPSRLRRYSRLMMVSQGDSPEEINKPLHFRQSNQILDLFRLQYAVVPSVEGMEVVPVGQPFPRFFVVGEYEVLPPESILYAVGDPSQDLRKKVFLESEPVPKPGGKMPKASVRLLKAEVNAYEIEVVTAEDAILLVTDSYSRDWRATPLPGNGQLAYRVMPANYAMRAVPVLAGRHRLRLAYCPQSFFSGLAVSGAGVLGVFGFFCYPWLLRKIGLEEREERGAEG